MDYVNCMAESVKSISTYIFYNINILREQW